MTLGTTMTCPHGGMVQAAAIPPLPVVTSMGQTVLTTAHTFIVNGATCAMASSPGPCTQILWTVGSTKILIGGKPALISTASGQSVGPAPGPGLIMPTPGKVWGT